MVFVGNRAISSSIYNIRKSTKLFSLNIAQIVGTVSIDKTVFTLRYPNIPQFNCNLPISEINPAEPDTISRLGNIIYLETYCLLV